MLSIENDITKTIDFEMILLGRGLHEQFLIEPCHFFFDWAPHFFALVLMIVSIYLSIYHDSFALDQS